MPIRGVLRSRQCMLLIALLSATMAFAQTSADKARREALVKRHELYDLEDRAFKVKPQRRDAPIRYLNISDDEAREVQAATFAVIPDSLVNIGTVVTGCPCEDGAECADQVWIVVNRPSSTQGLLLSKISGKWGVGPVQRWWLRFERLQATRFSSYEAREDAKEQLLNEFPVCINPVTQETIPPGQRSASPPMRRH